MGSGSTSNSRNNRIVKCEEEKLCSSFDIGKVKRIDSYVGSRRLSLELQQKKSCIERNYKKSSGNSPVLLQAMSSLHIERNTDDKSEEPALVLTKIHSQIS